MQTKGVQKCAQSFHNDELNECENKIMHHFNVKFGVNINWNEKLADEIEKYLI